MTRRAPRRAARRPDLRSQGGSGRRSGRWSGRRSDRGVASLELLGMVPLALVFAVVVVQVAAFMVAVTAADEAVRSGARAVSLGRDGCGAAEAVMSDSLEAVCTQQGGELGTGSSVRLVVRVPVVGAVTDYVPDVRITREAFLP